MKEKPKPIWQSAKFWINNLLLIISLLQLFIDSPLSNKKMDKYGFAAIRMMKMLVKVLNEEKAVRVLLQLLKDE